MALWNFNVDLFKRFLKEALVDALREQRELPYDVFAEVLEDFALAETIREGQETRIIARDEVFRLLQSGQGI